MNKLFKRLLYLFIALTIALSNPVSILAVDTATDPSATSSAQTTSDVIPPVVGTQADGNVGTTDLQTGAATAGIDALTSTNTNALDTTGCSASCEATSSATIQGNGAGSTTDNTNSQTATSSATQTNTLDQSNNLGVNLTTGSNSTSTNVGDSLLKTGDANVAITDVNLGNLNSANVDLQQQNITGTQTGDINFKFSDLPTNLTTSTSGNGAGSNNSSSTSSSTTSSLTQTNQATLDNTLTVGADTGNNMANQNVGDSSIQTGAVNMAVNVVNFLNTNLTAAASVLVATVNIFGNLTGNIILPTDSNSTGSSNSSDTSVSNFSQITQTNTANITNNLTVSADTGSNDTSQNVGSNNISTGDLQIGAHVQNEANLNAISDGGTWWLIIVNNLGTWTGGILGTSSGTIIATNLLPDLTGSNLSSSISGNGAGSTNTDSTSINNQSSITQTNLANLTNNVTLNANTGNNTASQNVGSSSIQTGNINIALNIANFINNNLMGRHVVVAFINIFGSFTGNIAPPGYKFPVVNNNVGGNTPDLNTTQTSSSDLSGSTSFTPVITAFHDSNPPTTQTLNPILLSSDNSSDPTQPESAVTSAQSETPAISADITGSVSPSSSSFNPVYLGLAAAAILVALLIIRRIQLAKFRKGVNTNA